MLWVVGSVLLGLVFPAHPAKQAFSNASSFLLIHGLIQVRDFADLIDVQRLLSVAPLGPVGPVAPTLGSLPGSDEPRNRG